MPSTPELAGVFEDHLAVVEYQVIDNPNAWVRTDQLGQCGLAAFDGFFAKVLAVE